jgi:hypothetical protein
MFLFAKLVMRHLHQQLSLEALQKQIQPDLFPNGLEQAYVQLLIMSVFSVTIFRYARIFDRIRTDQDSNEVEIARKILGWMACARRPLKWHEIQGAISTKIAEGTIDFVRHRSRKHIREICGSLVNDLSGDRLELIHSTAKQ